MNLAERLRSMEINRAVLWGIAHRGWSFFAGPISIFLVASCFTPEVQGYYYSFSSLLALNIFAELGLGVVVVNFSSREWASLKLSPDGMVQGDATAKVRLSCLLKKVLQWFLFAAIILCWILLLGGLWLFQVRETTVEWTSPWLFLAVLASIQFLGLPFFSVLEGCNFVGEVNLIRLIAGVGASVGLWLGIVCGLGLWVNACGLLVNVSVSGFLLAKWFGRFFQHLLRVPVQGDEISWWNDLFPMQWRIAVSWISGFFSYNLFVPVLFRFHGPEVAGKMGMTWTVVSTVTTITNAWVSPQFPRFGLFLARGEHGALEDLVKKLVRITVGVGCFLNISLILVVALIGNWWGAFPERFLPLGPTILFMLGNMISIALVPIAGYLRAHREEPLYLVSVLSGVLITGSNLILGFFKGAAGMGLGFFLTQVVLLPVVWRTALNFRKKRHGRAASGGGS